MILHTKHQHSKPCGFRQEDFFMNSLCKPMLNIMLEYFVKKVIFATTKSGDKNREYSSRNVKHTEQHERKCRLQEP